MRVTIIKNSKFIDLFDNKLKSFVVKFVLLNIVMDRSWTPSLYFKSITYEEGPNLCISVSILYSKQRHFQ